jgi:hypothetical protein
LILEARFNVAEGGKRFRCEFIREGPVDYSDIGMGIEVLRRETIAAALNSYIGRPLTLGHVSTTLAAERLDAVAEGRVDKVGWDPETGWFFCEGTVETDAARAAGMTMRPSAGLVVKGYGPAGRWNNVKYERELTAIEFHHLALVPRGRYEEADFRLNAVTTKLGEITMFKFIAKILKKNAEGKEETVTEERELPADTEIDVGGTKVRLNALIESKQAIDRAAADAETARLAKEKADKAAADAAARNNAAPVTDETEVLVDGKKVTIKDLKAAHAANATRGNAVKAAADARAAEEAKAAAEKERLNAAAKAAGFASYEALAHAQERAAQSQISVAGSSGSEQEALERGAARYGSVAGKN